MSSTTVPPIKEADRLDYDARQLTAILESSGGAIVSRDLDGIITSWNRAAERLFGYEQAGAIGQSIRLIIPDDRLAEEDRLVASVRSGETLDHFETVRVRNDRTLLPISLTLFPIRSSTGDIIGVSEIARDLRVIAHKEALLKSGALQSAIFNSPNFSSIATDANGVIQIFNVGAERMLGYAAGEVTDRITPADISDPHELVERAKSLSAELGTQIAPGFEALVFKASRGIADIYELTYIRKDGSRFPAVVSVTAMRDVAGTIIGYLLIGTDNSARQQAEEAQRTSEARSTVLFESAPDGILIVTPESYCMEANPSMCRMLGYTHDELLGLHASEYLTEQELPRLGRPLEGPREWQFRRKDGSVFEGEAVTATMPDGNRMGMIRDITARKAAEIAVRESESRYHTLFERAPDGIVIADSDGYYTDVNAAMCQMIGYTRAEFIGLHSSDIVAPSEIAHIDSALDAIKATSDYHREWQFRRKDGSLFTAEVVATQMPDGNPMAMVRDITERKGAEEERQRLVVLAQVKSEFLANMSHELRTPLNAIIGFAELMHRGKVGPVSAEHEEYLGDILSSSKHLLQLINDILDLAKVESGKMEFRPQPVDLTKLAREVCDILRGLVASEHLQVETIVDPDVRMVVVDPARVKQILYNYLSNAIKFTPPGGRITFRILPEGTTQFRIDVKDTGVGIAATDFDKLFVEFQQLDATSAKRYQGTGLGLALTKKLATAHGGRVEVQSKPGEGSTFSAILPRVMKIMPGDEATGPSVGSASGNRTILVVDDDPSALKIASLALREMGYHPVCSTDPDEALRTVAANPPGIVIVDLLMPEVDGFEFVSRFRAMPAGRDVPIIVWTVKDLDADERRRLEPSITALVSKNAGGSRALVKELRRILLAERAGQTGAQ
jgi:PAS domain S-box-containing protein